MSRTVIDRRNLIAGSSALILIAPRPGFTARIPEPVFLTSAKSGNGYSGIVIDADAREQWTLDLPGRGHGSTFRPGHAHCVIFARRPGTFAVVADRTNGLLLHTLSSPEGRHFYGHGCFSEDGRLLYTTENDFDGEKGVIGIWDAADGYRRIGELDSLGVGPHDIRPMPDGRTLVIANGGIATHPDTGRHKLNIPDMEPSLVLLDRLDGSRVGGDTLSRDLHKLSIRHLAVGRSGTVFAAMQYEGPAEHHPPLILKAHKGSVSLLKAPQGVRQNMKNYCGSIALDVGGRIVAATCPRGNMVTFWTVDGEFSHTVEVQDGCGVAAGGSRAEFLLSGGEGDLVVYDAADRRVLRRSVDRRRRWDNHISA